MASPQPQHQRQRRLFANAVVVQGAAVQQLLAGKDQALLIRGDACGEAGGRKHELGTANGSAQEECYRV